MHCVIFCETYVNFDRIFSISSQTRYYNLWLLVAGFGPHLIDLFFESPIDHWPRLAWQMLTDPIQTRRI